MNLKLSMSLCRGSWLIIRDLLLLMLMSGNFSQLGCDADTQVLMSNHEVLDPGVGKRRVLHVDGREVECLVAESSSAGKGEAAGAGPLGYVLFFVGQGDRAERYITDEAQAWRPAAHSVGNGVRDAEVEVWGMNYPGAGGSQGPNQIARVGPDALAVFDNVKKLAGDRPVFVEGVSLGTAAALCVVGARPVSGVILTNPPPLRQLIIGEYSWWNLGLISHCIAGEIPADLDSIANASRATAPAVILSAGSDETVPPKYQRMVIDAYAGPKEIIEMPGRGHEDDLSPEAVAKLAAGKDWLWRLATAETTTHWTPNNK